MNTQNEIIVCVVFFLLFLNLAVKIMELMQKSTVEDYLNEKIYIEIRPTDSWNDWYYVVYFEDLMSPFYKVYDSTTENKYFESYASAFDHAQTKIKEINKQFKINKDGTR